METRAHYVLIGAFVLSAVAAAFLFVLWLGQSQREFDEYDVIFKERVTGLSVGAAVRFNGIQKGEVGSLNLDPDDPSIVIARVRVDKDTPVKVDTKAELEPVGFTGLAIIQFVGGSAGAALLKDASELRVPQVEAGTSGIAVFLEGTGDVLAQAQRLLSDENIQDIADILANIETLTGVFAENDEEISSLLQNANSISVDAASVMKKLDAAAAQLQHIMENDAAATLADVHALIGDLREITAENRQSLKIFSDQGLGQVAPALAEGRRLMKTLDYILREIDRNPQAYFLGEQAPEYEAGTEQ